MKYALTLVGLFLLSLAIVPFAFAQGEIAICPQSTSDFNFAILCSLRPQNAFPTLLTFILIAAVVIALAYLIWGGIKWIMSGGDKGNVETARNTIVAAVIGLIIVFLSWFIINFILTTFFGRGLGAGLSLPGIFSSGTPPPLPTPTPEIPVIDQSEPEPTPTPAETEPQEPEDIVSPTVPLCPTAYPPDYLCQMPPDQIHDSP